MNSGKGKLLRIELFTPKIIYQNLDYIHNKPM